MFAVSLVWCLKPFSEWNGCHNKIEIRNGICFGLWRYLTSAFCLDKRYYEFPFSPKIQLRNRISLFKPQNNNTSQPPSKQDLISLYSFLTNLANLRGATSLPNTLFLTYSLSLSIKILLTEGCSLILSIVLFPFLWSNPLWTCKIEYFLLCAGAFGVIIPLSVSIHPQFSLH